MNRRTWLQMAAAGVPLALAGAGRAYRVALIGEAGSGGYGHDWDTAWNGLDDVSVIAVADAGPQSRRRAAARSHAQRSYADYRDMLAKEKPDVVNICPTSPAHRLEMVTAAAQAGAHLLIEKPLAQDLVTADQIVATADAHHCKIQLGLVMRTQPAVIRARQMLAAGEIGALQEMRARGKEDNRAGGEDMAVLGPHLFDLMRMFAGDPRWVFAHVTDDGREIDRTRVRRPEDPVGPVAGNQIAAMFAFEHGVHGYFSSKSSDAPKASRFGLYLYGSRGAIYIGITKYPEVALVLRSPSWRPNAAGQAWEPIATPDDTPLTRDAANTRLAKDLIQAVEARREPACGATDARWTVEMLQGVYSSQKTGRRAEFPLKERRHPLEEL